jgi:HAD superfamily hydrolase (TIGR01662 family)
MVAQDVGAAVSGLIELDWLKFVSFDLDKTLTGYVTPSVPEEAVGALTLLAGHGIKLALVSNARGGRIERVRRIGDELSDKTGARVGTIVPSDATGQAKPHPAMFEAAAKAAGVEPGTCIHVGDQFCKDIIGAERAGFAGTVLVAPIGEGDHLGVRLLQRPVEFALRPILGYPTRTKNFPDHLHHLSPQTPPHV